MSFLSDLDGTEVKERKEQAIKLAEQYGHYGKNRLFFKNAEDEEEFVLAIARMNWTRFIISLITWIVIGIMVGIIITGITGMIF